MEVFIVIFLCCFLLATYFYLLKGTVFGITFRAGNYCGFFVLYQIIMYIVPSSILLTIFPISNFWVAFKVEQDTVFFITALILISMILFYTTLAIVARIIPKYLMSHVNFDSERRSVDLVSFVRISLVSCVGLILIAWFFLNVGHSFSLAMSQNVNISSLRYELNDSQVTKFIKHLFIFIAPLLTAAIFSHSYDKKKVERFISFLVLIFISSWGGSKGPLLIIFIVSLTSYMTFNRIRLSYFQFAKLFVFSCLMLIAAYYVVTVQYGGLSDVWLFLDYFSQRVFVAQMIGVYEQFNLWLQNEQYFLHGLPFASYFYDFPVFHKDLMMVSEGRINADNIGIKNTLYIAEAFAMGGWFLLFLSPIITAFNFSLSFVWMTYLVNLFAFKNLELSKVVVAISLFSYIGVTGGFSDLMLFKITLMVTILISPFLLTNFVISKFKNIS